VLPGAYRKSSDAKEKMDAADVLGAYCMPHGNLKYGLVPKSLYSVLFSSPCHRSNLV
jgi:hypothetical protein